MSTAREASLVEDSVDKLVTDESTEDKDQSDTKETHFESFLEGKELLKVVLSKGQYLKLQGKIKPVLGSGSPFDQCGDEENLERSSQYLIWDTLV